MGNNPTKSQHLSTIFPELSPISDMISYHFSTYDGLTFVKDRRTNHVLIVKESNMSESGNDGVREMEKMDNVLGCLHRCVVNGNLYSLYEWMPFSLEQFVTHNPQYISQAFALYLLHTLINTYTLLWKACDGVGLDIHPENIRAGKNGAGQIVLKVVPNTITYCHPQSQSQLNSKLVYRNQIRHLGEVLGKLFGGMDGHVGEDVMRFVRCRMMENKGNTLESWLSLKADSQKLNQVPKISMRELNKYKYPQKPVSPNTTHTHTNTHPNINTYTTPRGGKILTISPKAVRNVSPSPQYIVSRQRQREGRNISPQIFRNCNGGDKNVKVVFNNTPTMPNNYNNNTRNGNGCMIRVSPLKYGEQQHVGHVGRVQANQKQNVGNMYAKTLHQHPNPLHQHQNYDTSQQISRVQTPKLQKPITQMSNINNNINEISRPSLPNLNQNQNQSKCVDRYFHSPNQYSTYSKPVSPSNIKQQQKFIEGSQIAIINSNKVVEKSVIKINKSVNLIPIFEPLARDPLQIRSKQGVPSCTFAFKTHEDRSLPAQQQKQQKSQISSLNLQDSGINFLQKHLLIKNPQQLLGSSIPIADKLSSFGLSISEDSKQINNVNGQNQQQIYEYDGVYEGNYHPKSPMMRHGIGRLVFPSGGSYQGGFVWNKIEGWGKLFYPSGRLAYQGYWKNNRFEGYGKLFNQNCVHIDAFDCSDFNKAGSEGYWKYYEGNMKADMKEGHGVLVLENGEKYDGEFQQDFVHGPGTFYGKKEHIEGIWNKGILTDIIKVL